MGNSLAVGGGEDVEDSEPDAGRPHRVDGTPQEEFRQRSAGGPLRDGPYEAVSLDHVEHRGHLAGTGRAEDLGHAHDPLGGGLPGPPARCPLAPGPLVPGLGDAGPGQDDGPPEGGVLAVPDGPPLLAQDDIEQPVSPGDQVARGVLRLGHRHPSLRLGSLPFPEVRGA